MQVSKWGNSLAIRLPANLVKELGLREGDNVDLIPNAAGKIAVSPDERRRQAIERLRSLRFKLPPGYRFNREEINDRALARREEQGRQ